jgi:hypothetical protein
MVPGVGQRYGSRLHFFVGNMFRMHVPHRPNARWRGTTHTARPSEIFILRLSQLCADARGRPLGWIHVAATAFGGSGGQHLAGPADDERTRLCANGVRQQPARRAGPHGPTIAKASDPSDASIFSVRGPGAGARAILL